MFVRFPTSARAAIGVVSDTISTSLSSPFIWNVYPCHGEQHVVRGRNERVSAEIASDQRRALPAVGEIEVKPRDRDRFGRLSRR
jgi:hypothetical protein